MLISTHSLASEPTKEVAGLPITSGQHFVKASDASTYIFTPEGLSLFKRFLLKNHDKYTEKLEELVDRLVKERSISTDNFSKGILFRALTPGDLLGLPETSLDGLKVNISSGDPELAQRSAFVLLNYYRIAPIKDLAVFFHCCFLTDYPEAASARFQRFLEIEFSKATDPLMLQDRARTIKGEVERCAEAFRRSLHTSGHLDPSNTEKLTKLVESLQRRIDNQWRRSRTRLNTIASGGGHKPTTDNAGVADNPGTKGSAPALSAETFSRSPKAEVKPILPRPVAISSAPKHITIMEVAGEKFEVPQDFVDNRKNPGYTITTAGISRLWDLLSVKFVEDPAGLGSFVDNIIRNEAISDYNFSGRSVFSALAPVILGRLSSESVEKLGLNLKSDNLRIAQRSAFVLTNYYSRAPFKDTSTFFRCYFLTGFVELAYHQFERLLVNEFKTAQAADILLQKLESIKAELKKEADSFSKCFGKTAYWGLISAANLASELRRQERKIDKIYSECTKKKKSPRLMPVVPTKPVLPATKTEKDDKRDPPKEQPIYPIEKYLLTPALLAGVSPTMHASIAITIAHNLGRKLLLEEPQDQYLTHLKIITGWCKESYDSSFAPKVFERLLGMNAHGGKILGVCFFLQIDETRLHEQILKEIEKKFDDEPDLKTRLTRTILTDAIALSRKDPEMGEVQLEKRLKSFIRVSGLRFSAEDLLEE